ncbi:Chaperone protein TorD [Vibrio stylophorae]|uniref:Chaperone protein TorD n=1 Tax=Vibrio stylophorae TaxID=659351 RepID=A0ABN8DTC8_9VIBR|nr:molecular chaperone TorD [Vibrio stylophorae]CAH0533050.1 Chaperone protein TorD [Vibrio stylophorae]
MSTLDPHSQQRATIYWWLSTLFALELDDAALENYRSDDCRLFLQSLGENEALRPATEQFWQQLQRQLKRTDGQLELAADFCTLFLTSPKTGALPYASVYLCDDGLLNGAPAVKMREHFDALEMTPQAGFNEPCDHLALILDLMGNLAVRSEQDDDAGRDAIVRQLEISNELLRTWVDTFAEQCQRWDNFGFYGAASYLLATFIAEDNKYLTSLSA